MSEEQKTAVEAEATDPPDTERIVSFDDLEWKVKVDGDGWPLEAGLAFSELLDLDDDTSGLQGLKHIARFVEAVVGPGQWKRFQAKPGRRVGDLNLFFRAITQQAYGFKEPGE